MIIIYMEDSFTKKKIFEWLCYVCLCILLLILNKNKASDVYGAWEEFFRQTSSPG